jgi:hypothetical protein
MWYILKRGIPVKAKSFKHYNYWSLNSKYKCVKQEHVGDIFISTVFLGLDHGHNSNIPVLWETMIFGGEHDQYMNRYSLMEDAVKGHQLALNLVNKLINE